MKHLLIVLFLTMSCISLGFGQGSDNADLVLNNGDKIECKLFYPVGNHDNFYARNVDGKVYIEKNDGIQHKIDSDDIKYIIIKGDDYKKILRYTQTRMAFTGTGKITKYKSWMMQKTGCKKLHSYVGFGQLYKDKDGKLIEAFTNGQGEFYLQSEGEKIPSHTGYVFLKKGFEKMKDQQRKTILARYFKGNTDAEQKLLANKKSITELELDQYIKETCN